MISQPEQLELMSFLMSICSTETRCAVDSRLVCFGKVRFTMSVSQSI